jgi:DNA-binding response OmpR family regulator/tetratricopeptide (TPR) repeat protein
MGQKILIIEDFEKLREALKTFLAPRGYEVFTAADGIEGLKAYAETVFDLLVLDLRLPRMNGIEVLKKVRQTRRGATLPVIIISGAFKGANYQEQARKQFGVQYYLEKPFSYDVFLKAVQAALTPPEKAKPQELSKPAAPAAPPPLRGKLQAKSFDRVLTEVVKQQLSGVLRLARNGEEKAITFSAGAPRWLNLAKGERSFGHYLLEQGKVSLVEHKAYEDRRRADPRHDPTELFIKMGCFKFDEYFQLLRGWAEEEMVQVFGWTEGEFAFLAEKEPAPSGPPGLNLARVVHRGYQQFLSPAAQGELYQEAAERYLALAPGFYEHQMLLDLSHAESVFLEAVDGAKTLLDLTPADPEDSEIVIKGLKAFLALDMVRLSPEPVSEPLPPPFPIREALPEPAAEVEAKAAEEGEGFEDLAGDLSGELTAVVDNLKQAGPPPAPVREVKPVPQPAAGPGPAPLSEAEEQRKREDELLEFCGQLKDKNYYELLGMTQNNFDFSRYKAKYFELTKQFSPDKFLMSSGDVLAKSEDVLTKLATAFNTLSNVVSKEKYDELLPKKFPTVPGGKPDDKMQAEVAYQSGMAFLQMEDWEGAEKSLGEAASLDPRNADCLAHLAFATFMRNRRNKSAQVKANELLTRALKLKPACAPAFAYRGTLLIQEEKFALAEAELKKALRLNPRLRHALAQMKLIEEHKQKEKKGLLGRLRG